MRPATNQVEPRFSDSTLSTTQPRDSSYRMASATAMRSISSSRTIEASCGLVRSGCGNTWARPRCVMSAMAQ